MWFFAIDRTLQYHFDLVPQEPVTISGRAYRLDFRVLPADILALHELATDRLAFLRLAVEVDGHQWHERTRQQVEYRNRRGRDLQTAGRRVFHFGEVRSSRSRLGASQRSCVWRIRRGRNFSTRCTVGSASPSRSLEAQGAVVVTVAARHFFHHGGGSSPYQTSPPPTANPSHTARET